MRPFLLFLLLIPFTALAQEKKKYCNEETTYEMRECAFIKLVQSDKTLKQVLKFKTFEEWVGIRQTMCEEAYMQYKEGIIYPMMILRCSVDMNKTLLRKTRGLN